MPLNFIKSNRNQNLLLHDGYLYFKKRENKSDVTWRCVKYYKLQCNATIHTDSSNCNGNIIGCQLPVHSHANDLATVEARAICAILKKHAQNSDENPSKIIDENLKCLNAPVVARLPQMNSLRRAIQRSRQQRNSQSNNASSIDELNMSHRRGNFPRKSCKNDSELCRTCLKPNDSMISIDEYIVGQKRLTIAELLNYFNCITIPDEKNIPKHICVVCFKKLQKSYEFQLQCLQSEDYWRTRLSNDQTSNFSDYQSHDSEDNNWNISTEGPSNPTFESQMAIKSEPITDIESKMCDEMDIEELNIKQEYDDSNEDNQESYSTRTDSTINAETDNESNEKPTSSNFRHRENQKITCSLCKIKIDEEKLVWNHIKEMHSNSSTILIVPCRQEARQCEEVYFFCKECDLYSISENSLMPHLKFHLDMCFNECSFCGETFENAEFYYRHLKRHFIDLSLI